MESFLLTHLHCSKHRIDFPTNLQLVPRMFGLEVGLERWRWGRMLGVARVILGKCCLQTYPCMTSTGEMMPVSWCESRECIHTGGGCVHSSRRWLSLLTNLKLIEFEATTLDTAELGWIYYKVFYVNGTYKAIVNAPWEPPGGSICNVQSI